MKIQEFLKNNKYRKFVILVVISCFFILLVLHYKQQSKDYEIEVHFDHVEIVKYVGNDTDIVIPNRMWGKRVTVIQRLAFSDRYKIESVKLPKYLERLGDYAFHSCGNLETVQFGKNTKIIEDGAFGSCGNLRNVSLNEGLKEIGKDAFSLTKSLETIVIPESVEKIGRLAFGGSGLQTVTFEGENAHIGKRAFENTEWQESQEGFLICGDKVLIEYNGEEEIVRIPDGVKYIVCEMYDEESVKEIYVPNTVISIDESAAFFRKEIVTYVPASVTEIIGIHEKATYDSGYYSDYYKDVHVVTTAGSYMEEVANKYGMQCTIVDEIIYPEEK